MRRLTDYGLIVGPPATKAEADVAAGDTEEEASQTAQEGACKVDVVGIPYAPTWTFRSLTTAQPAGTTGS